MSRQQFGNQATDVDFSVIIPTFNRPRQLAHCLESLACLNFPRSRFEVIVVDDGTPKSLEPVVEPFRGRVNLVYLRTENGGPAAARNRGVEQARGNYLAFTDDDCQPDPDWLTMLAEQFRQTPDNLIGGRTINRLSHNHYSAASQIIVDVVYAFYNRDPRNAQFFAANNVAVSAQRFREVGGFNRVFRVAAEDRELCDRWRHRGRRLTYAPEAMVYHAHDLTLRSFLRQHFNYGRAASPYHKLRVLRSSGRMRDDTAMHFQLPALLRKPMSQLAPLQRIPVSALLVVWQAANAAGFLYEKLCGTACSSDRQPFRAIDFESANGVSDET